MHQESRINLSIVIPVYNEELYIEKLFADILKYFNKNDIEIIFVNVFFSIKKDMINKTKKPIKPTKAFSKLTSKFLNSLE